MAIDDLKPTLLGFSQGVCRYGVNQEIVFVSAESKVNTNEIEVTSVWPPMKFYPHYETELRYPDPYK